jgi:hypothetical protein
MRGKSTMRKIKPNKTKTNKTIKTKTMKNNKTIKTKTMKNNTTKIYSKTEYNSGDGMLTAVWGPPMWHYLHTMSFNFPVNPTEEEKHDYMNFVLSLQKVLPCKYCRMNLGTNLKQLPLTMNTMKDRDSFSRYVYGLHELVNKMLHKNSNLTFCEVRERYEHFRARCTDEKPKLFKYEKLDTKTNNKKDGEKGCTEPLYGKKSKCIIKIVPQEEKGKTFQIDKKCIKTR